MFTFGLTKKRTKHLTSCICMSSSKCTEAVPESYLRWYLNWRMQLDLWLLVRLDEQWSFTGLASARWKRERLRLPDRTQNQENLILFIQGRKREVNFAEPHCNIWAKLRSMMFFSSVVHVELSSITAHNC